MAHAITTDTVNSTWISIESICISFPLQFVIYTGSLACLCLHTCPSIMRNKATFTRGQVSIKNGFRMRIYKLYISCKVLLLLAGSAVENYYLLQRIAAADTDGHSLVTHYNAGDL